MIGLHVARADDQHGMHLRCFGALDFAVDLVGAVIAFGADHVDTEFLHDGFGIVHQRFIVADRENTHLFGRKPEREIAGVMLDQKADEPFVRAERRAMDAERRFIRIVAVAINESHPPGLGEIHLVGRQREFAADHAPDLHVNLRAVERGLVGHLDEVDATGLEDGADHVFGLLPQRGFVDELGVVADQARRVVRAEAHDVFFDAENFEILQIHFVHGVELGGKLLRRAIDVGVVHVERPHAHEAD